MTIAKIQLLRSFDMTARHCQQCGPKVRTDDDDARWFLDEDAAEDGHMIYKPLCGDCLLSVVQ